jgi:exosortase/archaeosortase family protein
MASRVASGFMNASGVPVLCEGNRMTLPGGVQMFVAEACSGMRQLTGFLALSAAVAYLCMRPAWYRVILVAAALPIALFANITRIVVTGYIMHFVNPQYAAGAYHTLEGVLLMGFGLFLLNSACTLMDLFCETPAPPDPGAAAGSEPEPGPPAGAPRGGRPILRGADGWAGGRIAGKLSLSPSEELP